MSPRKAKRGGKSTLGSDACTGKRFKITEKGPFGWKSERGGDVEQDDGDMTSKGWECQPLECHVTDSVLCPERNGQTMKSFKQEHTVFLKKVTLASLWK